MKTHLSLLIFFASFTHNFAHSACYESTPEKQKLIQEVITKIAQEYIDRLHAPEFKGEINKKEFYDFLQQRIMNSKKSDKEELAFLSDLSNGSMEVHTWLRRVKNDPTIRIEHHYRLKASCAWQCRVGIGVNCLIPHWDNLYPEGANEILTPVESNKVITTVREHYPHKDNGEENDTIVQWRLEASHDLAQETLRLFFTESQQQKEQQ